MLTSSVCKYSDFHQEWYRKIEEKLKFREMYTWHSAAKKNFVTRKFWEWCFIASALEERGKLEHGARGLGFAVGTEPLASYFASRGCSVLATDLHQAASSPGWIERNEHAASLDKVFFKEYLNKVEFDERVSFKSVDMRTLEGVDGQYDFVWSSCALEHLGSMDAGMDFVVRSSKFLKPGGVAVHTTEYNVSSGTSTIEIGDNVVFRSLDLINLSNKLEECGYYVRPFNFESGDYKEDIEYDTMPYFEGDAFHIKLDYGGFTCTSCSIIIQKSEGPYTRPIRASESSKPQGKFRRILDILRE